MTFPRLILALALALTAPSLAQAQDWTMRPAESAIDITARQQGADFKAQFETFSAAITFDPADLSRAAATITIDTASFNSKSRDRDSQVRDKDWFHTAMYPDAVFKTKSFKDLGNGRYEAIADLTIRGLTKEVVLPFELKIEQNVARMSGEVTLNRTDFGVGQGDWASGAFVGLDVKVRVTLVADAAG